MPIKIEDMSISYSQEGDSCGEDSIQDLEIKTQDAGGGVYYVIKTERWAIENISELKDIFADFEKRFKLKTKINQD